MVVNLSKLLTIFLYMTGLCLLLRSVGSIARRWNAIIAPISTVDFVRGVVTSIGDVSEMAERGAAQPHYNKLDLLLAGIKYTLNK